MPQSLRARNLALLSELEARTEELVQVVSQVRNLALSLKCGVIVEAQAEEPTALIRGMEVFSFYRDRVSTIQDRSLGVASGQLYPEDHQSLSESLRALAVLFDPVGTL